MAHWAEVDENNIVLRVTVGDNNAHDEGYQWLIDNLGGTWVKTSYNSSAGKRINPETGEETPDHFRYNYAGIGFTYDPDFGAEGAFIPPQPFPSWTVDPATATWVAPVAIPDDGGSYMWDEASESWQPVEA